MEKTLQKGMKHWPYHGWQGLMGDTIEALGTQG